MSQNKITIGIKIPINKPSSHSNTPLKVQNYSYFPSDEVGLGYISHVYLGRNDLTNEIVAMKVMDISKEDELGQQLIQEEINILEYIRSHQPKHLLLLHDHFKLNNHLYIITEYCEGKDIAKALRKKKVLSQCEAQSIMKQLMKAYKQLHGMKIIHRDLKLSNILVQKGHLKLADFGFSIKQQRCNEERCGYNVGSPFYMPPETLKMNKYSFKSDIWALGVMAYEMVYGKLPWKEKVQSMLYDKIIKTNLEQLFDPAIIVSQHYKAFIRSCLHLHVDKRATPESIIAYVWPLANDNIQGLPSEPNSRPMSMLQQLASSTHKKFATHHFIPQNANRSNNNSFSKIQPLREKSPNFLNKDSQPPKLLINSTRNSKQMNERSLLFHRKQFESISRIIVSQIHFIRFLQQIQQKLINCNYSDGFNLRYHLRCVSINKLKEIGKIEKGTTCAYSELPYFNQYKSTEEWHKLKHILRIFVETSSNWNSNDTISEHSLSEQMIVKGIRELKLDLQKNFSFVEDLTYLYQLKLLQNRKNLTEFCLHSKIQLLCNRPAHNFADAASPDLMQRLNEKLTLLDV